MIGHEPLTHYIFRTKIVKIKSKVLSLAWLTCSVLNSQLPWICLVSTKALTGIIWTPAAPALLPSTLWHSDTGPAGGTGGCPRAIRPPLRGQQWRNEACCSEFEPVAVLAFCTTLVPSALGGVQDSNLTLSFQPYLGSSIFTQLVALCFTCKVFSAVLGQFRRRQALDS